MIIRKSDSDSYDIVVIARMSPVQNARTRRLIRALAHDFKVRAISESPDGSRRKGSIDGVKLDEIPLPLPRLHVWYLTGWLRVVYFNFAAAYLALKSNASAVGCSDSIYYLAVIIFKIILQRN